MLTTLLEMGLPYYKRKPVTRVWLWKCEKVVKRLKEKKKGSPGPLFLLALGLGLSRNWAPPQVSLACVRHGVGEGLKRWSKAPGFGSGEAGGV